MSVRGEGFARRRALPASPCNNTMDSRCQSDKQMDCHNRIKMQGIQKLPLCCVVCGSSPEELMQNFTMSYSISTLIKEHTHADLYARTHRKTHLTHLFSFPHNTHSA